MNAATVGCDVVAFEEALAEGRTALALEHYHGDFLAGLHVPDAAPDLEEWIASERRRLRGHGEGRCGPLGRGGGALRQRVGGDVLGAPRRGARSARGAQRADTDGGLERQGDRAGALRVYEDLARRLSEELDVEPGAGFRRLAEELRAARAGPAAPAPVSAPPAPLLAGSPPAAGERRGRGTSARRVPPAGRGRSGARTRRRGARDLVDHASPHGKRAAPGRGADPDARRERCVADLRARRRPPLHQPGAHLESSRRAAGAALRAAGTASGGRPGRDHVWPRPARPARRS